MGDDAKGVPTGIELTALDETFRRDPYPVLESVRSAEPVHYDEVIRRWVLTRHDDVDALLRDRTMASDPRKAAPGTYMQLFIGDGGEPSMLMADDPAHARLRGLVNKAFTPRAIEGLRPRIQAIVGELLDGMEGRERADVIDDFAGPLPTIVIAEMLGVDPADRGAFKRWSDTTVMSFDPLLSDERKRLVQQAGEQMDAYLRRVILDRREEPRDDLISSLVAVEEDGDRLATNEIVRMCGLLLAAGNVTTTDLIGNGVLAMLRHPDQLEMLRADPLLVKNAVEEMLRYDSPVIQTARIPMNDVEYGGCPVRPGESIMVSLAAANHDPAVYDAPNTFDITRADTHHHAFGGGVHFCLGAPLARLEAQLAFPAVFTRFPRMRLTGETLEWRKLPAFRGLQHLPVLLT